MELLEYIQVIKKRKYLIIIITLLSMFISAMVSYFIISPKYKANISVIIGKSISSAPPTTPANYNDLLMYQKSVKTYSLLATSRKVLGDVAFKLNLDLSVDDLGKMVSATPSSDTEFLTLTVTSKDPELAVNIANQLAKSLKDTSIEIKKDDIVQLVDDAELPKAPVSPKPLINISIAFFLGLIISIGIAFLIEHLDNTIKSQDELEKLLNVPVIGYIPNTKDLN